MNDPGRINPEIEFPELKTTGESYVKGCPPGHMPFVMQPLDNNQAAIFCFSHWNPFPPRARFNRFLPSIADKCIGRGKRMALARLFGWAEQVTGSKVPNFRPDYFPKGHLIKHEDALARLRAEPHTLYCGDDCAAARSHAILWKAVFAPGLDDRSDEIIVGESPKHDEGEWVDVNGDAGDGQKIYCEFTSADYKVLIREREIADFGVKHDPKEDDPVMRKGDPRGFASEQETSMGKLRFFEVYAQDESDKHPLRGPMYWQPAAVGRSIAAEMAMLDLGRAVELLACDWDKPVDASNHPHQLISDQCQNLIHCLINWNGLANVTGKTHTPNPYKDFVDVWRYINDGQSPYLDPTVPNVRGGGGW